MRKPRLSDGPRRAIEVEKFVPEWRARCVPLWRFLQCVYGEAGQSKIEALLSGRRCGQLWDSRCNPKTNLAETTLIRFARRYLHGKVHVFDLPTYVHLICRRYALDYHHLWARMPNDAVGLIRVVQHRSSGVVRIEGDAAARWNREETGNRRVRHMIYKRAQRMGYATNQKRLDRMSPELRAAQLLIYEMEGI